MYVCVQYTVDAPTCRRGVKSSYSPIIAAVHHSIREYNLRALADTTVYIVIFSSSKGEARVTRFLFCCACASVLRSVPLLTPFGQQNVTCTLIACLRTALLFVIFGIPSTRPAAHPPLTLPCTRRSCSAQRRATFEGCATVLEGVQEAINKTGLPRYSKLFFGVGGGKQVCHKVRPETHT